MPLYRYLAIGSRGIKRRGKLAAPNEDAAQTVLQESGLFLLQLSVVNDSNLPWWKREIHAGPKVSSKEFAVFCRQLATLVRSGVTLLDSVRIMAEETDNKSLKQALLSVAGHLAEGLQLSQALANYPNLFKPIFVNMIRAGETSGNLEGALESVARYFEKDFVTREKIKSALVYPVAVGIMAVLVVVFLLVKIVPTFMVAFAQYGAQMPLPTRIVIGVSHFITHGWWGVLAGLFILWLLNWVFRRRLGYLRWRERLLLRLPVFGRLRQKVLMARMARTMSSLVASAVPLLQGLQVTSEIVDNTIITETLRKSAANLQSGLSLAQPLRENPWVPPLVSEMVSIGEQTGSLDYMLEKVADFYETEVDSQSEQLKSLMEPFIIVFLAVIVGVIVLAVILPSFTLLQNLH